MPASAPPPGPAATAQLSALGAMLRARRKALGVSAVTTAEAAGMSRTTLHRIEAGEPSVTVGAVVAAAEALGLALSLTDPHPPKPGATAALPAHVHVADFPQLKQIAWQLDGNATLTPREVLSLYERNWRHVDVSALTDAERALVRGLVDAFGGRLLV